MTIITSDIVPGATITLKEANFSKESDIYVTELSISVPVATLKVTGVVWRVHPGERDYEVTCNVTVTAQDEDNAREMKAILADKMMEHFSKAISLAMAIGKWVQINDSQRRWMSPHPVSQEAMRVETA